MLGRNRCLRERLEEGIALLLALRNGGGGSVLVLLADGEVHLLNGLVERLGVGRVGALGLDKVVDVEAEGVELPALLVGSLGPVGLGDVLREVLVDAVQGLSSAGKGLRGGELLEGEAGAGVLAGGLGEAEVAGLCRRMRGRLSRCEE